MAQVLQVSPELQKAVEAARDSFMLLTAVGFDGTEIFNQCKNGQKSIIDVFEESQQSFKDRKSTARLERFQKCTASLQGLSNIIDVAVQTKADFLCPIWAPIKFVLKISEDHACATDQVLLLFETLTQAMGHVKLYEKLEPDGGISSALLRLFTDVVDYCIRAAQYFGRRSFKRLAILLGKPYKHEFSKMRDNIRDHVSELHRLVMEYEAIRASQARDEQRKDRCRQWLRPCAMTEVHQRHIEARLQGTCEWIQTNQIFMEWKTTQSRIASDRVLQISGIHGCGKSVLASAIVQGLEADGHRVQLFSFSTTDVDRQSAESLARFLIARALKKTDKVGVDAIHDLFIDDQHPSTTQLWSLLGQICEKDATPAFFVVDGLDEASTEPHEVLDRVSQFLEQCVSSKCIVLGRPNAFEILPQDMTQAIKQIHMDQLCTGAEIDAYIDKCIVTIEILSDPDLRTLASATLKANIQDMFLWGKLMIDDLRCSYSKQDVTEKLQDLPQNLEHAYERAFNRLMVRLRKNEIHILRNVLTFVVSARRPLSVTEIAWALAVQAKLVTAGDDIPVQSFLIEEPEKRILHVCGEFVTIRNSTVLLNHASIKDFLTREESVWTSNSVAGLKIFHVDVPEANNLLARICFEYLDMENHGFPMRDPDNWPNHRMIHPLMEYAAYNFVFHAMAASTDLTQYSTRLESFCSSERVVSWLDHLTFSWMDEEFDESLQVALHAFLEEYDALSGPGSNISARISAPIRAEISHRTALYGPDSLRTSHLRLWSMLLQLDDISISGSSEAGTEHTEEPTLSSADHGEPSNGEGHTVATRAASTLRDRQTTQRLLKLIQSASNGGSQHSVMATIGVFSHFLKTKATDPLRILYHLLLEKANHLPVYVLLRVSEFYSRREQHEKRSRFAKKSSSALREAEGPWNFGFMK